MFAMTYKQLQQETAELQVELKKKSDACPNTLAKTALDNAQQQANKILLYITQAQQLDNLTPQK